MESSNGEMNSEQFNSADVLRANQILYGGEASSYDSKNHVKSRAIRRYYESLLNGLLNDLDRRHGCKMLDVGCGTGFLEDFLVARGAHVYAVDATAAMLETARAKFSEGRVSWIRADATRLPFSALSFDMVCSNAVLHHLYDWRSLLRQMIDLLKPEGRLLIGYEPNAIPHKVFRPLLMAMAKLAPEEKRWNREGPADLPSGHLRDVDVHKLAEFHIFYGRGIHPFKLRRYLLDAGLREVHLHFTSLYQALLIKDYGIPLPLDFLPQWVFKMSGPLSLSFSLTARK
jgi:SAM-dependent methyltransferase